MTGSVPKSQISSPISAAGIERKMRTALPFVDFEDISCENHDVVQVYKGILNLVEFTVYTEQSILYERAMRQD